MTEVTGAPLNGLGEFRKAVLRIITWRGNGFGGTAGYLLSQERVQEITSEARRYAHGLVAAERERIAAAVPPGTLEALADWLARDGTGFSGMPDLPGQLKELAGLIHEENADV